MALVATIVAVDRYGFQRLIVKLYFIIKLEEHVYIYALLLQIVAKGFSSG